MLWIVIFIGVLVVVDIMVFVALGLSHPAPWVLVAITVLIPILVRGRESKRFVEWKDSYSVGIERIDNDHKRLLSLINNLETAIHYNTGETFEREALDELIAYTQFHFKLEEDLMQEHGYPDLEAHKGQHDQMISIVQGFVRDYEKKGHKELLKIAEYLKQWLIQHINGTDQKYAPFLHEKGVK